MTPFGAKLRELRAARGITLKQMAEGLQISSAFLSALEHGKRGRPSPILVRQICGFFHIIWEDAEELERLARISHPRVVVDTAGLSPKATELANTLAERIGELDEDELDMLLAHVKQAGVKKKQRG
jgi:transcriptional regulator with XRE-family HTH domain